jgi:hypothetical protein
LWGVHQSWNSGKMLVEAFQGTLWVQKRASPE